MIDWRSAAEWRPAFGAGHAERPPKIDWREVAEWRPSLDDPDRAAARALGVYSLGLGLFVLTAPEAVKRALGLKHPSVDVLRAGYGVREVGAGVALLAQPSNPAWVWARVGGDALDIATLVAADRSDNRRRTTLRTALAGVIALTAADIALALRLGRPKPATRLFGREFPHLSSVHGVAAMIDERVVKAALPAALALARRARATDKRVLAAGGAVLAVGAGAVALAALNARKTKGGTSDLPEEGAIQRAVTVNKPRDEVYREWRDLTQAPRWMEIVESITDIGTDSHRWVVRGPGEKRIQYDTMVTEARDGELLEWRSVQGSTVASYNRLEFRDAPGGRGTEIHATMTYDPPMGPLGKVAALVTQKAPEFQVQRDLRRFKQLMETGEIATTEGPGAAPSGRDKA